MSTQKRRLSSSDSDPYSSSPPSVEGTSVWSGKKGRAPRRPPRGKDLEMKMEELQAKMMEIESQMEEQGTEMDNLKKDMKELKRQNKEQEKEIAELRDIVDEQGKQMKKLKKEIGNKPNGNSLSSGNPSSSRTVQERNAKKLKLHIEMKVPKRVYTGHKLAGDPGNSIRITLIDEENGQIISSGIESSVTVHVAAIDGNFNRGDHEYWSAEEFDRSIVKGRKQKGQPLIGDLEVALRGGVGFINSLKFVDNSSWNQDRKFRIGVHVSSGYYEGTRIREAFTEPFIVLEYRGASNKKNDTPESSDAVYRLDGIGKDGRFHNRLKEARINNVEEFLQAYNTDPEALKSILGKTMSATKWNSLIRHAQKCPPNGNWLVYYCDGRNYAPLFNNFAFLIGFIWNGVPRPIDSLSDGEKQAVDWMVKLAHQNWKDVINYEGPHREAMAVPPGNHYCIPAGPSISENHPTQTSLQGYSSQPDATTNSCMAAGEATTSQPAFEMGGSSRDPLTVGSTSLPDIDGISVDELLNCRMRSNIWTYDFHN